MPIDNVFPVSLRSGPILDTQEMNLVVAWDDVLNLTRCIHDFARIARSEKSNPPW